MTAKPEPSIDPDEVIPIFTTRDLAEAEIVRNSLRAEGIKCELDGETQGGFVELVETKVLVRAGDADRARSLIEHHGFLRRGSQPPLR